MSDTKADWLQVDDIVLYASIGDHCMKLTTDLLCEGVSPRDLMNVYLHHAVTIMIGIGGLSRMEASNVLLRFAEREREKFFKGGGENV